MSNFEPIMDWINITSEEMEKLRAVRSLLAYGEFLLEFCNMNHQWSFRLCQKSKNS